jgi:hypothetical protein
MSFILFVVLTTCSLWSSAPIKHQNLPLPVTHGPCKPKPPK